MVNYAAARAFREEACEVVNHQQRPGERNCFVDETNVGGKPGDQRPEREQNSKRPYCIAVGTCEARCFVTSIDSTTDVSPLKRDSQEQNCQTPGGHISMGKLVARRGLALTGPFSMPATCSGMGTSRPEDENSERARCHRAAVARIAQSGNNNAKSSALHIPPRASRDCSYSNSHPM